MERWGRDWMVPEHDHLIATLSLPDPNDRHVLAAAIAAEVPLVVTFNLSDFPESALAGYGVRAVHPDTFASELLEVDSGAFLRAVRTHRAALKNPPKSPAEYLDTLRAVGLMRAAEKLKSCEI